MNVTFKTYNNVNEYLVVLICKVGTLEVRQDCTIDKRKISEDKLQETIDKNMGQSIGIFIDNIRSKTGI